MAGKESIQLTGDQSGFTLRFTKKAGYVQVSRSGSVNLEKGTISFGTIEEKFRPSVNVAKYITITSTGVVGLFSVTTAGTVSLTLYDYINGLSTNINEIYAL